MDKKQQAIQAAIELFATQGFEKNVYRTGVWNGESIEGFSFSSFQKQRWPTKKSVCSHGRDY